MDEGLRVSEKDISYLQVELQQQRGMLWLLGEIMKAAINISEFKELMAVLTDMLMGVMGVTTCYLWMQKENTKLEDYRVFFRSIELKNEFKELKQSTLPKVLKELTSSYVFEKREIKDSLLEEIAVPCSRLAVPLRDFKDDSIFGILALEHEEEHFFTENTTAFFEILSIFIASNAQNSKLLQSVSEDSITDPLTETYNRRYLSEALKSFEANYNHVTVAVIDIDNFKSINDEHGHMEGDIVLKGVAQLAKGIVKEWEGKVIRYGGDEFIIFIPIPLVEAIHILEEFRKSVHYLKITYDLVADISVTLGVCSYPQITEDYSQIIRAADNALIRGKVRGKNRVVLASNEDILQEEDAIYKEAIAYKEAAAYKEDVAYKESVAYKEGVAYKEDIAYKEDAT